MLILADYDSLLQLLFPSYFVAHSPSVSSGMTLIPNQWRTHEGGGSGVKKKTLKILKEMKTSFFGTNRLFFHTEIAENCSHVFLCHPTCLYNLKKLSL